MRGGLMSAHYPTRPFDNDAERDINRESNILPPVTVDGDRNTVVIGDTELPGQWIEHGGICVLPSDENGCNRLTVTFLVGSVDITDSALAQVSVEVEA